MREVDCMEPLVEIGPIAVGFYGHKVLCNFCSRKSECLENDRRIYMENKRWPQEIYLFPLNKQLLLHFQLVCLEGCRSSLVIHVLSMWLDISKRQKPNIT
jgi:hypothetical protein